MKVSVRNRLLATTLLASVAAIAAPAGAQTVSGSAQDVSTAQDDATASQTSDDVVVTGSRLARPDIESAAPVAVVGAEEIALQAGSANIENVLNDLPQITATTSNTSNNPGGGVATVNLRALGASRTLVLVDSKRYVSFDVTQQVDLNTIPAALIERVDVVTGGRSAVYGSDAIAGVVNFVLKKNFEGLDLQSQYNVTERGDGQIWDVNGTIGANFEGGRGNATVHVGYLKRTGTFAGARSFGQFALTNVAGTATTPPTTIVAGSPSGPQTRVLLSAAQAAAAGSFFGTGSTLNVDFEPNGSISPFIDTSDSYNFSPVNYLQVPQERFLISSQAYYEINDALVPYISAQFINNRVTTELAATPIGNSTPFGTGSLGALRVQAASPFFAPNVRAGLAAIDAAETTAGLDVRGDGYVRFPSFGYRTVPLGPRQNNDDRNAYRIMVGMRGDLGSNWSYDGSYMYARTKNSQRQNGNISISNFIAATTTAFQSGTTVSPFPIAGAPGGGNLVCADATARAAGCVPANIFGIGNVSQAAINYLAIGATNLQEYKTEHAIFALTNPRLFDFGTGPVGLAIGAEWRSENGSVTPDQFLSSGNVAGFNPQRPTAGGYSVREGFAELNVPLANDTFIHRLELNAAGRVSEYSNAPGTVYTYALNGIFAPVRDITFRGQYSRAIRGPSVNELFLGNTVSFSGNIDGGGCASAAAAPGGNLNARCIAQGVPAGVLADATARTNLGLATIVNPPTFIGGNPNLTEEQADTWTVGAILAPTFLPGFTATVDYYNIKITDYIARVGTQNIGNACFQLQLDAFCSLITRNSLGQIERIDDRNANTGGLTQDGIDVGVNYTYRPGNLFGIEGGSIGFSFNGTRLLNYRFTPVQGLPILRECEGRYGNLCSPASPAGTTGVPLPKWRHNARLTLGTQDIRGSLQWRYIGKVRDDNDAILYAVERLPARNYFDLTVSANVTDTFSLNTGVTNLFDEQPPLLASAQSGGSGEQTNTFPTVYDVIGRSFFVSGRIRF
jgi:iron complex outermembrane recepter protein